MALERLDAVRCSSISAASSPRLTPLPSAISFRASQKPSSRLTLVLWPLTTIDRLSTSDFIECPRIPKLTVLLVCTILVLSSTRRRASAIAGIGRAGIGTTSARGRVIFQYTRIRCRSRIGLDGRRQRIEVEERQASEAFSARLRDAPVNKNRSDKDAISGPIGLMEAALAICPAKHRQEGLRSRH
jgi:hypothetical protein